MLAAWTSIAATVMALLGATAATQDGPRGLLRRAQGRLILRGRCAWWRTGETPGERGEARLLLENAARLGHRNQRIRVFP